jgi:hypothetical protein
LLEYYHIDTETNLPQFLSINCYSFIVLFYISNSSCKRILRVKDNFTLFLNRQNSFLIFMLALVLSHLDNFVKIHALVHTIVILSFFSKFDIQKIDSQLSLSLSLCLFLSLSLSYPHTHTQTHWHDSIYIHTHMTRVHCFISFI